MKNISILILLPFFLILFSCDSDDDSPNCQGIDCLPEATQSGAGTFGCLVNGEPFYAFGSVDCQYQLVNGEYFFGVGFARDSGFPISIGLGSSNSELVENQTYMLLSASDGNKFANVGFLYDPDLPGIVFNTTDMNHTGIMIITKLDEQNKIVSGTFEFEILNPDDGQVYQITEGRFDSFYAQ
jgi:hypothetical protein